MKFFGEQPALLPRHKLADNRPQPMEDTSTSTVSARLASATISPSFMEKTRSGRG